MSVLKGKKAVVIGGSGGIGSNISRMLAQCGCNVVIHGSKDSEKFDRLLYELKNDYDCDACKIIYPFDAESFARVEGSVLAEHCASADILCVCYGPFLQKDLSDMTLSEWRNISLLDYALPGFFVSNVLKYMMKSSWGRILLFGGTGTCSRSEYSTNAAYAGAKTGIGTLVQSVAFKYGRYGITCNCILPGFTETEYVSSALLSSQGKKMPDGTVVSGVEIAESARFLLENKSLNGVLLRVDKGWSPLSNLTY